MLVSGGEALVARAHPILRARVGQLETSTARALMEAIDSANNLAVFVLDRRDIHHHPDVRAVGPLDPSLDAADRNTGAQHFRRRRLFAGDETTVEVELVRPAIEFAVIADTRHPAPEFGRARVEPENAPRGIAGVDRDRELLEKSGGGMPPRFMSERFEVLRNRRGPFLDVHCLLDPLLEK